MSGNQKNTFTDFLTRKVYNVNQDQEKQLIFYRNRIVIAIMLGIFLISFNVPTTLSLLLAGGFGVIAELRYRFDFLKKCQPVSLAQVKHKTVASSSMLLNSGLYGILGVLLLYLAFQEPSVESYKWFLAGIGAVGIVVAIVYLIQYFSNRHEHI
ncbi:hypothetical protein PT169_06280 [Erysipelothrix rhusiopathiae]|uniref:hypothetical protein n=1 Tax=Erysipelothrix rhusiopathiae TaxID=1648 RepID=UPI000F42F0E0|nr:hypothetical protein [Erysipelothrix rhusiopathiae]AYV35120.1 hypothetical protein EEY85_07355 [Erysipelothrix rhusiopathiae]MDE8314742.1 hypothetical protein [Erysipelothrix rhusiopathiae]MDE8329788.1 hypothetical protein [Erysipelothrix rhusiopathiae]MDE8332727.1 hypothetical protein [Erysipelothrix rhusiopathiae]